MVVVGAVFCTGIGILTQLILYFKSKKFIDIVESRTMFFAHHF